MHPITPALEKAFGDQGDNMNLAVLDFVAALPFDETVLGFRVIARSDTPHKSAVLARDQVEMRLAENGGDPAQHGCAFHVKDLDALFAQFQANGLGKEKFEFVAPDGLYYWFGERAPEIAHEHAFSTGDVLRCYHHRTRSGPSSAGVLICYVPTRSSIAQNF